MKTFVALEEIKEVNEEDEAPSMDCRMNVVNRGKGMNIGHIRSEEN